MSVNTSNASMPKPPKLLDQLRAGTRLLYDSKRTEDASVGWSTKLILFTGKRHPNLMGVTEIENGFV